MACALLPGGHTLSFPESHILTTAWTKRVTAVRSVAIRVSVWAASRGSRLALRLPSERRSAVFKLGRARHVSRLVRTAGRRTQATEQTKTNSALHNQPPATNPSAKATVRAIKGLPAD